jgi:hypothetical protein
MLVRCLRRFGCVMAGGVLLQATGGCQSLLTSAAQTLGQDVVSGIGAGLGNLAQAAILNLII